MYVCVCVCMCVCVYVCMYACVCVCLCVCVRVCVWVGLSFDTDASEAPLEKVMEHAAYIASRRERGARGGRRGGAGGEGGGGQGAGGGSEEVSNRGVMCNVRRCGDGGGGVEEEEEVARGIRSEEGGGHLLLREGDYFVPILPGAPIMQLSSHELADVAVAVAVAAHVHYSNPPATQRACDRVLGAVRLVVLRPECLRHLDPTDAVGLCWAYARVGSLDHEMMRQLGDAITTQDHRRAVALTQQVDLDGWQLVAPNSLFDEEHLRPPPEWATEEHVLHLIHAAMASNGRRVHAHRTSSTERMQACLL